MYGEHEIELLNLLYGTGGIYYILAERYLPPVIDVTLLHAIVEHKQHASMYPGDRSLLESIDLSSQEQALVTILHIIW